jgi:hypothetical protein
MNKYADLFLEAQRNQKLLKGMDINKMPADELTQYASENLQEPHEDQSEIVYEFPDGWTIRRLNPDEETLYSEGEEMQNCIKDYEDPQRGGGGGSGWFGKIDSGYCSIYSLRDTGNRPHASIETNDRGGDPDSDVLKIYQLYGKNNSPPIERYQAYIDQWFKALEEQGTDVQLNPSDFRDAYRGAYQEPEHDPNLDEWVEHPAGDIEDIGDYWDTLRRSPEEFQDSDEGEEQEPNEEGYYGYNYARKRDINLDFWNELDDIIRDANNGKVSRAQELAYALVLANNHLHGHSSDVESEVEGLEEQMQEAGETNTEGYQILQYLRHLIGSKYDEGPENRLYADWAGIHDKSVQSFEDHQNQNGQELQIQEQQEQQTQEQQQEWMQQNQQNMLTNAEQYVGRAVTYQGVAGTITGIQEHEGQPIAVFQLQDGRSGGLGLMELRQLCQGQEIQGWRMASTGPLEAHRSNGEGTKDSGWTQRLAMPYADNTWYHVTDRSNLPEIAQHGLQGSNFGQNRAWSDFPVEPNSVYLWPQAAGAWQYFQNDNGPDGAHPRWDDTSTVLHGRTRRR